MYFKEHFKNSNKVLQIAIKYLFHDYTASPKHLGGWEKFWDCILGLHIGLEFTKPPLSLDEAMWTWKSALLLNYVIAMIPAEEINAERTWIKQ